jgi:hypothetical protein
MVKECIMCWSVCTGCCTGFVINVKLEAAWWFTESSFRIWESKKGGAPTFDIMIHEIAKHKVLMRSGPSDHERLWDRRSEKSGYRKIRSQRKEMR